jgi:hypothetical protein
VVARHEQGVLGGLHPVALRATDGDALRTVFRVERDWSLDAAAAQACRFPSER